MKPLLDTNCIESEYAFAAGGQWQPADLHFTPDNPAGSVMFQFTGFTIKYNATVQVRCDCGCAISFPSAAREVGYTDNSSDTGGGGIGQTFEFYKVGDQGISIDISTSLADALGNLITAVIQDNIPPMYGCDGDDVAYVASRIQSNFPSSPSDGQWLSGKSPCN